MNLDEIFSFENLYNVHKSSRLSKQHRKEIINFEINLATNLYKISKKITNRTYKLNKYYAFYIHEPKERLIEALPYKDRVVIKCFCDNCLIPKLSCRLINDNVACQKAKGSTYGIKRLEEALKKEYRTGKNNEVYYLKCDVRKYFQSIDHEILLSILKRIDFSDDEMWFVEKLVREQPNNTCKGLTLGNQSSQWFALLYLNGIDRLIKEKLRVKGYVRYMDDMILIHRDKEFLRRCKKEIESYCTNNLKLSLNDKTQIGKASLGIDFLGYRHVLTPSGKVIRKLRKSSKIRMKKHLRTLQKLVSKGLVDDKYVLCRTSAFKSHLAIAKEHNLTKILQINKLTCEKMEEK